MSSEFERLEQLFHAAESLAPDERRGYLDGLDTEDAHLREDLEELLDMRSVASDFFEGETGPTGGRGRVVGTIVPGDVIGEFEITGVIASGGMGTVYAARQARPRRTVALKVIRGDVATASTLERFELEAEILGSLEHPGIARIFAAGVHAAESGDVPWFAMEFIDGVSLTEYADTHGLDRRARLELFCDVCDAASHAHRRGVIHRDLKPQNILVGADGVAKILDFGVARVTGDDLQLATIEADLGRIVGTLAYMSPEQTLADPHAIDTRSDIYALGAILHELLSGRRPFDLRDEPLPGAVAIIRDVDAPLLGTLDPRLRGDLEVIVAHALEKERTRRYGSSGEFAADVRRYLADEPILARPSGAAYRFRKFVRRNPALTIAVAGIAVALIAGILGTAAGLREARTEAELKDRAIADYERMSDVERLDSALEEAETLWPLHADLVPRLEEWQRRYGAVFERLPVHEATLERLRGQAESYDEPERRRDFTDEYGLLDFLEQERARLEDILDEGEAPAAEDRLEKVLMLSEKRAEALRRDLESRRRWSFGDDVDRQFLHDTLEALVARLRTALDPDPHVGVVADIARRLERARRIEDETVTSRTRPWRDAAKRVAADARFDGFELRPIMGLVPLGADPDSGLEEFLHWASHEGVVPRREAGRVTVTEATGIILVLVPGGRFLMGAQNTDRSRPHFDASATRNEMPPCEVELAPFMISKYEMTQAQWTRAEGENPSYYVAGKRYRPGSVTGLHPVESVDHPTFVAALRRLGLALPTDAQWERAARAGTETSYYTGSEVSSLAGHANLADEGSDGFYPPGRANVSERGFDDGHAMHAPVGSFLPNGYGLHDIHGNVFEWCRDIRTLTLHPLIHYVRPGDGLRSPADSDPRFIVVRGGAFAAAAVSARISGRGTHERTHTSYGLGCRPARPATP